MSSNAPPAATPALCTTASRKPPVWPAFGDAVADGSGVGYVELHDVDVCGSARLRQRRLERAARSRLRIVAMTRQPRLPARPWQGDQTRRRSSDQDRAHSRSVALPAGAESAAGLAAPSDISDCISACLRTLEIS